MEQFHDGQLVWLRSRVHGTYLHADDDGEGVSLRRRRTSLNAAWVVHIYPGDDGPCLLLHNAAYGRYLAATTTPAPLGHRGFRAVQRNYDQSEVEASQDIMWQAVGAGSGNDIMLRNVSGCGRYLRANGRYLIWNNGVSVDEFDRVSTMRHWIVEPIPARLGMPALPGPARVSSACPLLCSSRIAFGGNYRYARNCFLDVVNVHPSLAAWTSQHVNFIRLRAIRGSVLAKFALLGDISSWFPTLDCICVFFHEILAVPCFFDLLNITTVLCASSSDRHAQARGGTVAADSVPAGDTPRRAGPLSISQGGPCTI
ncbi:unnamed protein product [Alopecurus aequalis]